VIPFLRQILSNSTSPDDHSRYCVIAKVVERVTGRAVCLAVIPARWVPTLATWFALGLLGFALRCRIDL
jgi:hypothetical protein